MTEFIIVLIMLVMAGASNAVMDVLRFRYSTSVFVYYKNQQWWNPKVSWRNKWKDGDSMKGERYWGSSRWFVRFTDAWHFFQGMMFTLFMACIVLYKPVFHWAVDFIVMYFVFTSSFQLFYSRILIKIR